MEDKKAINVLYIHNIGVFGGASRSLLHMIDAFPEGTVKPHFIAQKGEVIEIIKKKKYPYVDCIGFTQFDNTDSAYYKGIRWFILLREAFYIVPNFIAIFKASRKFKDIDVIHINAVKNYFSLILAKLFFKKPVVYHIRSLQKKDGWIKKKLDTLLLKWTDRVIAIDKTVQSSISKFLPTQIIHNGFDPYKQIIDENVILQEDIFSKKLTIVFIGNLLPLKGIWEYVKAAKLVKENGLDVNFLIVGNYKTEESLTTKFLRAINFPRNMGNEVIEYIKNEGLQNHIHFTGFIMDISKVLKKVDLLAFPSRINACGRPVFEAAFFNVPSIVAIKNPYDDTIIDQETGFCIEERSPKAFYDAIKYFYDNPSEIERMGANARALADRHFDITQNAKKMLDVYKEVINDK